MTCAYIGLGSNLNCPDRQITRALSALACLPACHLLGSSSLYHSHPMGPTEQPDYVNAVAAVKTDLSARELLQELQRIEQRHGRAPRCSVNPGRPADRWGPRVLDLDLLLYGEQRENSRWLTLPHPGIGQRDFVLMPLLELDPGISIPGMGSARVLLTRLDQHHLHRQPTPVPVLT